MITLILIIVIIPIISHLIAGIKVNEPCVVFDSIVYNTSKLYSELLFGNFLQIVFTKLHKFTLFETYYYQKDEDLTKSHLFIIILNIVIHFKF